MNWFTRLFRRQLPPPTPPPTSAYIHDSFEADSNVIWYKQQGVSTNLESINFSTPKAGSRVLRVRLDKSDPWVAGGPRSEIYRPNNMQYWGEGTDIQVKFSIFLPSDYVDDPTDEILYQVHPTKGDGNPLFMVKSRGGDIVLQGKGFSPDVIFPKTKGAWMDFEIRHFFKSSNQGSVQVRVNGSTKIAVSGVQTMQSGQLIYPKFGIYKGGFRDGSSNVTFRELYFDEIYIN